MENYSQEKVKILLIEDDIADIELLDAYLSDVENFYYDLTSVYSLEEARDVFT